MTETITQAEPSGDDSETISLHEIPSENEDEPTLGPDSIKIANSFIALFKEKIIKSMFEANEVDRKDVAISEMEKFRGALEANIESGKYDDDDGDDTSKHMLFFVSVFFNGFIEHLKSLDSRRESEVDYRNPGSAEGMRSQREGVDQLNISSIEWQQDVMTLLLSLDDSDKAKKMAQNMWNVFENVSSLAYSEKTSEKGSSHGAHQMSMLKNGILSVVGATQLCEGLGYELILSTPEQDIKGADAWLQKKGAADTDPVVALQLKSKLYSEKIDVSAEEIEDEGDSGGGHPRQWQSRDELDRQKLLTFAKQTAIVTQRKVVPVWMEIHDSRNHGFIDKDTGHVDGGHIWIRDVSGEAFNQVEQMLRQETGGQVEEAAA